MKYINAWKFTAILLCFRQAYTNQTVLTTNLTSYNNLTIPFLETDDQSYRHIAEFTSIITKHSNRRNQDEAEVENASNYNSLRNNVESGTVRLLPDKNICGPLAEEERIYGGENTAIDEFPWLVRIKYILDNGKEVYACAGSLITDHYVVTAAHCAVNLTIKEVRIGDWNIDTEFDCQGSVCSGNALDIKVVKVTPFPGYSKMDTFKGDIALLRLQRPVKFTGPFVYQYQKLFSNQDCTHGSIYWTAGWGKTEFEKKPSIKRKVELNAVPISECRVRQPILSDDTALFTICAGGTDGKDTCAGDSGGSLVKQIHENNKTNWFLVGVTSYGHKECGSEGRPGLYARITPFINWIIQNIES